MRIFEQQLLCRVNERFKLILARKNSRPNNVKLFRIFSPSDPPLRHKRKSPIFHYHLAIFNRSCSFQAFLAMPKNRDQLRAIINWAKEKNLPSEGSAGFWTNYIRIQSASDDHLTFEEQMAIRQNRLNFGN